MIVESRGLQIDGFKIPPFELKEGEIIILYLGNSVETIDLKEKLFLLFSGKKRRSNLILNEKLERVKKISQNKIKELFFPRKVKSYLYKKAKSPEIILEKILAVEAITPETKIIQLPANTRKMIALFSAYSHSRNVVFDLDGLDPLGAEKVFEEVQKELKERKGAAILLDSFLRFENNCTRHLRIEN